MANHPKVWCPACQCDVSHLLANRAVVVESKRLNRLYVEALGELVAALDEATDCFDVETAMSSSRLHAARDAADSALAAYRAEGGDG